MRIALGQINPTVGDLSGNLALMIRFARDAAARKADWVVFPELSITGYPPRDLVEKPNFLERSAAAVEQLADATRDLPMSDELHSPLRTAAAAPNPVVGALARNDQAALATQTGDFTTALDRFREALAIFLEIDDRVVLHRPDGEPA